MAATGTGADTMNVNQNCDNYTKHQKGDTDTKKGQCQLWILRTKCHDHTNCATTQMQSFIFTGNVIETQLLYPPTIPMPVQTMFTSVMYIFYGKMEK